MANPAASLGSGHPKSGLARRFAPQSNRHGFLPKRHRKVYQDNIRGVTNSAIRRLARRGGVSRISATIYDEVRATVKLRLVDIIRQLVIIVEHPQVGDQGDPSRCRKTVLVQDIIFVLNRLGSPIWGFDPAFNPKNGKNE